MEARILEYTDVLTRDVIVPPPGLPEPRLHRGGRGSSHRVRAKTPVEGQYKHAVPRMTPATTEHPTPMPAAEASPQYCTPTLAFPNSALQGRSSMRRSVQSKSPTPLDPNTPVGGGVVAGRPSTSPVGGGGGGGGGGGVGATPSVASPAVEVVVEEDTTMREQRWREIDAIQERRGASLTAERTGLETRAELVNKKIPLGRESWNDAERNRERSSERTGLETRAELANPRSEPTSREERNAAQRTTKRTALLRKKARLREALRTVNRELRALDGDGGACSDSDDSADVHTMSPEVYAAQYTTHGTQRSVSPPYEHHRRSASEGSPLRSASWEHPPPLPTYAATRQGTVVLSSGGGNVAPKQVSPRRSGSAGSAGSWGWVCPGGGPQKHAYSNAPPRAPLAVLPTQGGGLAVGTVGIEGVGGIGNILRSNGMSPRPPRSVVYSHANHNTTTNNTSRNGRLSPSFP